MYFLKLNLICSIVGFAIMFCLNQYASLSGRFVEESIFTAGWVFVLSFAFLVLIYFRWLL